MEPFAEHPEIPILLALSVPILLRRTDFIKVFFDSFIWIIITYYTISLFLLRVSNFYSKKWADDPNTDLVEYYPHILLEFLSWDTVRFVSYRIYSYLIYKFYALMILIRFLIIIKYYVKELIRWINKYIIYKKDF